MTRTQTIDQQFLCRELDDDNEGSQLERDGQEADEQFGKQKSTSIEYQHQKQKTGIGIGAGMRLESGSDFDYECDSRV